MKHNLPVIDGSLERQGTNFVAEKLRLGCIYYSNAYLVREFSRYAALHPEYTEIDSIVTKQMVEKWLQSRPLISDKSVKHRATMVRQLAIFMNRHGETAYILPSLSIPKCQNDFTPYIFTEQQLAQIFEVADRLIPSNISPYRHLTMPLMFRLIYGCGLRASEAIGLCICDVDLENGILAIRDTKFGKNRTIPMAESLRLRCLDYHRTVHLNCTEDDVFFSNLWKNEYNTSAIYKTFCQLLKECGIRRVKNGPRVHDLRHTYAVHTLKRWSEGGCDLSSALPLLSTYMGHNSISGTQKYLRLTAELYPHVIKTMERAYGDIFPKGSENDA